MKKMIVAAILTAITLAIVLSSCSTVSSGDSKNIGVDPSQGTKISDGNDSVSVATPVKLGDTISLKVFPAKDVDCYSITLSKSTLLRISTKDIPSNICPFIRVSNDKGIGVDSGYAEKEGNDYSLPVFLPAGKYCFSLRDKKNINYSELTFSLSFTPFNQLSIENNTGIADIEFGFRAQNYKIGKGQIMTLTDIDVGKHSYNFKVLSDDEFELEKPTFELDYSSKGTRYLVNVFRTLKQKIVETKEIKNGVEVTTKDTVLVSTFKSTATIGRTD